MKSQAKENKGKIEEKNKIEYVKLRFSLSIVPKRF